MAGEHGTYACYTSKCPDCPREDQQEAKRQYDRRVTRLKAYGRWDPFVDAEPVRRHVNQLRANGFGGQHIANLAGVPYKVISALIWGVDGLEPSKHMRHWNAERLLALNPPQEDRLPRSLTDPTGTARRLQALQAVGWSQSTLARFSGIVKCQINRISIGKVDLIFMRTAWQIRDLYEALWDQEPPQETPGQKRSVAIARRIARENGWAPPMAWDDETIDDPAAEPVGAGVSKRVGKLPDAEEIAWLVQGGDSLEVIADRYGASVSAVNQKLLRAKEAA